MKRKQFTIEYDDTDAGLAAVCPSTTDVELKSLLKNVSLFQTRNDGVVALSEEVRCINNVVSKASVYLAAIIIFLKLSFSIRTR